MPSVEIVSQCFGLNGTLSLAKAAGFPSLPTEARRKPRAPGPSPVPCPAPEYATSPARRVDKPHVLDLHLGDLEVLQSGEERSDITALSTLLTSGDPLLDPPLDNVV